MTRLSPLPALLPIFTVVGTVLFGCSSPESFTDPSTSSEHQTVQEPDPTNLSNQARESSPSIESAGLLRFADESTRKLALRILAIDANENTFIELLTQSKKLPSLKFQLEVQQILIEELALLNPERALESTRDFAPGTREILVKTVFRVWSIADLDQAIDHAIDLDDLERLSALEGILTSRDDLLESTMQELAAKILPEDYSNEVIAGFLIGEPINDPQLAWDEFIARHSNDLDKPTTLQIRRLARIAQAYEQQNRTQFFERINSDISNASTRFRLINNLVNNIALENPSRAFEIVTSIEPNVNEFLAARVVSIWGQIDPEAALASISSIQSMGLRFSLSHSVVQSWVFLNPHSVVSSLERLPEYLRASAREQAITMIAFSSPKRASELFVEVESFAVKQRIGEAITTSWARSNFEEALNWIRTSPSLDNANLRNRLMEAALDLLAWSDPQRALEIATGEELDASGVGLEASVIASVASYNLASGVDMLVFARNEPTALRAVQSIGQSLVQDGNSQIAVDLVKHLSPERHDSYLEFLIPSLSSHDPGVLIDHLDSFSSSEVRRRAASIIRMKDIGRNSLTKDQLDQLRKYLPEEDSFQ